MGGINKMPILSLIIPVYGTEQYLKRCLDSVLAQSYTNIEIIVVNDCSPGDVEIIISSYKEKVSNIKYIRHEHNRGLFQARLTGYTHSSGKYIAFLDSDDYVSIDFYRKLVQKAERTHADIVIGRTVIEKSNKSRFVYNMHDSLTTFKDLEGKEIEQNFWEQEGLCYSYHTIWNKIYSRHIWELSIPFFSKMNSHIVMTEDIAFSAVLFHFARKMSMVEHEAYFYCENPTASTNSAALSIEKYSKNVRDIYEVFNFIENFLSEQQANDYILKQCSKFRKYYAKMWRGYALNNFGGAEQKKALIEVDKIYPGLNEICKPDEYFFNSILSPWSGGLEYAKKLIASDNIRYVSFDIYDTLIMRPVYEPKDVFEILN